MFVWLISKKNGKGKVKHLKHPLIIPLLLLYIVNNEIYNFYNNLIIY